MVLDYALRKAISGREQDLGFTLTPRRLRQYPTVVLTDLDYADDISLLSDSVEQAQELLNRVELECAKVGLRLNAKKTEVITYNILTEHPPLTTTEGTVLKEVKDFKYLGSWVNSTEQDLKTRRAEVKVAMTMVQHNIPLDLIKSRVLDQNASIYVLGCPSHIMSGFEVEDFCFDLAYWFKSSTKKNNILHGKLSSHNTFILFKSIDSEIV
ncbi:hypothetical protein JOQ06_025568 [Pogonophryne albipinna]|uniref:Reverse transcriptase domain-containing protein n=1 Tax=Pogonophryne albipinna TaxID=1090488 RepID=A0AAD6ATW9_9TELE|nr:hypothetical protein JOQ06_008683 [Pogonophryne albipinna]KAJ4931271.1 hypothetical protein JOQ06_025568 [Pogonophryne albipinna]